MLEQALPGVLPPIVFSLVFLAIAWRPWKKAGWPKADWGSALGVALGYIVADELVRGTHKLWPSGGEMHPHIALLAAVFVVLTARPKLVTFRALLAVILTVAATALVLRTPLRDNREHAIKVIAIASAAGLAMWSACALAAARHGGARVPLMLWAAAAGNAVMFLQNTSISMSQMSGALAACMGGFVLLGWWRPHIPAIRGAIPVYVLVMLGLMIVGRHYDRPWEQSHWSFVLGACAVASPALTLLPPVKKLKPWQGTLVGLILTVVLCIAAIALSDNKFDFSTLNG